MPRPIKFRPSHQQWATAGHCASCIWTRTRCPPSLPSSSEAAVILSHLSLHASYIQGTTSFLLTHVKSSPDMLDPNMEPSEAEKLTNEISGAVTAVSSLHTEVQTLQNHIHKVRPCLVSFLLPPTHPSFLSWLSPSSLLLSLAPYLAVFLHIPLFFPSSSSISIYLLPPPFISLFLHFSYPLQIHRLSAHSSDPHRVTEPLESHPKSSRQ